MTYRVNFFDPNTPPIDVQDAQLNSDTHLTFVGKNWYGYGETIAENQLNLLENFASNTPPSEGKAVEGQLYYNKAKEAFFYFYKSPLDTNHPNYQPTRVEEWRYLPGSSLKVIEVYDTNSVLHTVTVGYDVNESATTDEMIFTISNDPTFDVHTSLSADIAAIFPKIGKGITLATASGTEAFKFHGTATTAQYADLAELYESDAEYEPGTVVKIGGEKEVTQTTTAFDPGVFGIVSTDPAYLMNSAAQGTVVPVALAGRVPVKVIGPVKKGQRLLSSEEPGVARAPTDYEMQEYMDWYRIVGRALEDKTTEGIGLVEVVVGAK